MIDFSHEGPFTPEADPLFPDRVRIVGLGQTGAAVCDQIVLHGRAMQDLWVFDSDQQAVDGSIVANRHLLGGQLVHGLGSSGDLELAREIVALEEERLGHVAEGCDFLILVLGLAGGTGLALAEFLIEAGHRAGAKVIVLGVQPFAFEGWSRREKAVKAIEHLRRGADSVLIFANDRLADDPGTAKNVRNGFHVMNQVMGQTAQALAQIVGKRGLVQLSFADLRSLYGRYVGSEALENCWATHVEGDIHDPSEELVETLLAGPLVRDEAIWKQADHAVAVVSGTREFGLSDVQELVAALKDRLPKNLPLATSVSLEEEGHEKVRLSLLLAMTAPVTPSVAASTTPIAARKKPEPRAATPARAEPLPTVKAKQPPPPAPVAPPVPVPAAPAKKTPRPAPVVTAKPSPAPVFAEEKPAPIRSSPEPVLAAKTTAAPRKFIARQEEMQFDLPTRGRFEKTEETIHNGENLDLPTFRRRGLAIRL
jgi:cell division protein FtsZ